MDEIKAKVANIISDEEIAFNVGSEEGAKIGTFATVQRRVTIKDPDSQEELGTVLVPILRLRLHLVDAKFSVGSVAEYQDRDDITNVLLTQKRHKKIVKTRSEEKSGISVFVTIGDIVAIDKPTAKPPDNG